MSARSRDCGPDRLLEDLNAGPDLPFYDLRQRAIREITFWRQLAANLQKQMDLMP